MREISKEMDEFLDKVDKLCYDYHYEMRTTYGDPIIIEGKNETWQVDYIDGDGRGK